MALLLLGTTVSLLVTFFYGLKLTQQLAHSELNKEGSVFFQSFMDLLIAQRQQYLYVKALR